MDTKKLDDDIFGKFWNILHRNGWIDDLKKLDDLYTYVLTIVINHKTKCFAKISMDENGLSADGHFGVLWIDVLTENAAPYDYDDLQGMLTAVECAEENLLTIGVPFTKKYKFHGSNTEEKQKRNDFLRNEWKLDEAEQMLGWKDADA